jgi:hypothetical protein
MKHLHIYSDYKELPDRRFFFGVLGTLRSKYLEAIIRSANRVWNIRSEDSGVQETIAIREDIFNRLETEPFFSSNPSFS